MIKNMFFKQTVLKDKTILRYVMKSSNFDPMKIAVDFKYPVFLLCFDLKIMNRKLGTCWLNTNNNICY